MRLNLQAKLLLPILGIVLLSLFLSLYFVVSIAEKAIVQSGQDSLRTAAFTVEKATEEQINRAQADIQITATMPAVRDVLARITLPVDDFDRLEKVDISNVLLLKIADIYGYYESYYMTNDKGLVATSHVPGIVGKLDISNRPWFQQSIKDGKSLISEPFVSRMTGIVLIAVMARVEVDGHYGGMVGALRLEQMLQNAFEQTRNEHIETALISNEGALLATFAKSRLDKETFQESPWLGKLQAAPNGLFEATVGGRDVFIAYDRMPNTNMYAIAMIGKDDMLAPAQRINTIGLGILAGAIIFSCLVIFLTVRPVVRVLQTLGSFTEAIGKGDFAKQLHVARTDELGSMATALQGMASNLEGMIRTSEAKTAEAVEQSALAQQAQKDAEQAKNQAEQAKRQGILYAAAQLSTIIAEAVRHIESLKGIVVDATKSMHAQQQTLQGNTGAIESLNEAVVHVLGNTDQASTVAEKTIENANSGAKIVGHVTASVSRVSTQMLDLSASTKKLEDTVEGISGMLGTISDIADQTNLLALNAAIEAARAGDAGRGFAVVADEVRKLADKTMVATQEIRAVVQTIRAQTENNMASMGSAAESVDESVKLVSTAGEALQEIIHFAESSASMVASIAESSRHQSEMSSALERGSGEIRDTAASNVQRMEEASNAVDALDGVACRIQNLIKELQQ